MSYTDASTPDCAEREGVIGLRIEPQIKNLGDLSVRRVLPAEHRKMIGPFIFFDHFGPVQFAPGAGIQVRPHPHIGIATITYLFDGEIIHRDSLGITQPIRAGAVNVMTAGSGIVHSERAGEDLVTLSTLHGIQSWMALPLDKEEMDPEFVHYSAEQLPDLVIDGVDVRIIIGEAYAHRSPVSSFSPMLYLECQIPTGATLRLPETCQELGIYVVTGAIRIGHETIPAGVLAVAAEDCTVHVEAVTDSRVMVIGGDPLGNRHIWWNFVSSSTERIEQAKRDWQEGRFAMVPGDDEFIPLPR